MMRTESQNLAHFAAYVARKHDDHAGAYRAAQEAVQTEIDRRLSDAAPAPFRLIQERAGALVQERARCINLYS